MKESINSSQIFLLKQANKRFKHFVSDMCHNILANRYCNRYWMQAFSQRAGVLREDRPGALFISRLAKSWVNSKFQANFYRSASTVEELNYKLIQDMTNGQAWCTSNNDEKILGVVMMTSFWKQQIDKVAKSLIKLPQLFHCSFCSFSFINVI